MARRRHTAEQIISKLREAGVLPARVLVERWWEHCSRGRPHSALGYRPPVPETVAFPVLAAGWAGAPGLRKALLRPPRGEYEALGLT
jgi:hypothetical protein